MLFLSYCFQCSRPYYLWFEILNLEQVRKNSCLSQVTLCQILVKIPSNLPPRKWQFSWTYLLFSPKQLSYNQPWKIVFFHNQLLVKYLLCSSFLKSYYHTIPSTLWSHSFIAEVIPVMWWNSANCITSGNYDRKTRFFKNAISRYWGKEIFASI